jgi:integrase
MSILRTSTGTWTYDFWHLGKRFRKRYKSRADALSGEAQERLETEKGFSTDKKLTFRAAAQLFFEKHSKPSKRSWKSDLSLLVRLNKLFGEKKLVDFTSLDIQNMRNYLQAEGLTSASVDRFHSLVKVIFNKMIFWEKFKGFNPANGVKLKREPNAHVRFLSRDEVIRLESYLRNDTIYPHFIGALHTGMRRGELCSLRWEHITFPIRDIYVNKSKSGKARHIPMNNVVNALLRDLYGTGKAPNELVFGDYHPDYVSHRFDKTCKKLEINDFNFHSLRHSFASHLVMAGVNIFQVSKWLGHSSVRVTESYYAHLSPDFKREEIEKLNRLSDYSNPAGQTNFRQTCENSGGFAIIEKSNID